MKAKYLFLALASVAFAGCEDLDLRPEGDTVTTDQKTEVVESLPERAQAGVNAVYSGMSQLCPNYDALGGLDRHNDIGYPSVMMFMDQWGNDVITDDNGYNWCGNSLSYLDRDYDSLEGIIIWNTLYSTIKTANSLIGDLTSAGTPSDINVRFNLAQGYVTRANMYLVLVQLYQFNYVGHENSPAVPLITDKNIEESSANGLPRATVQQVYDQITADLDTAIVYFKEAAEAKVKRADKRYADLSVAYGVQARTFLAMHKYAEAAKAAENAIAACGSSVTPASFEDINKPSFWDFSEQNWMWGIRIEETDDVVSSGIVNWISHCGTFNSGYGQNSGGRQINKQLYATIPTTDARKAWWSNAEGKNVYLSEEYNNYLQENEFAPYTNCKFAPYGGYADANLNADNNANDIVLMRIEEMYLIKAEGLARSGGDGASVLNNFMTKYRDPQYKPYYQDVAEEVVRQRRIEFWGEGLAWFDIMRLNKGVDRRGCGYHQATVVYNIPAGSDILLYRLTQSEIQANPALTDADNNPAAPLPTPVKDLEE